MCALFSQCQGHKLKTAYLQQVQKKKKYIESSQKKALKTITQ